MKKKEFILVNSLIAVLLITFGYLTFSLSVNHGTASTTTLPGEHTSTQAEKCSDKPPLKAIDTSEPHLKTLADYQKACSSFVTNKMMFFIGFSEDETSADQNAAQVAKQLKQFKRSSVTPIVIAEPYVGSEAMSYKAYLAGDYDKGTDRFFKQLKERGVSDDMMGTWVPFPEPNTPSWNNKDTEPKDFALCVNKYLGRMKHYFPDAKGSVLLNATTFAPTDTNWENGDYISFSEYVNFLDKDLVTSFGVQGFPWITNAQQSKRTIFKPAEFLQPDLAIGAAQVLRTRDIWINTGTFGSKYTNDPTKTVHLSLNERKALLEGILEVAKDIRNYQENEYRVSINLFSEDKSDTEEATDWSYLKSPESTAVLKGFLARAHELDMPVSLFDTAR